MKLTYILLTILMLSGFAACGQSTIRIPKEFVETNPPEVESKEWYQLNYSKNEYRVKINNGALEIKKVKEVNECELPLKNGKLKGIDRGEWGGPLIYQPLDTTEKNIEIKKGNIKYIFRFKDKIYFLEGLAHLFNSEGGLYELDTTNNSFHFKKILNFEDAPEAFTIYQDKLLIASFENFYLVKDFKKELVFKNTFWNSLYPNSIAVFDEKNVFLGIRGGIVKLDITNKTLKFFKN